VGGVIVLVKYGTLDYFKRWAEAVNNDEKVTKSGMSTTVLNVFTDVKNDEGVPKAFLLKYENGTVTEVREAKPDEKAEFVTSASYSMFVGIAKGEINPQKANPKYPLVKALKYMQTLNRIQEIAKELKDVQY
jgi:hypothetical protein